MVQFVQKRIALDRSEVEKAHSNGKGVEGFAPENLKKYLRSIGG